jgi:ABC-type transport system involved in cytochrome c biogenesis ATPase subunit
MNTDEVLKGMACEAVKQSLGAATSSSMRTALDEPFAALDVAAVSYEEELIGRHLNAGGSVVYTTQAALDASARA